MRYTPNDMAIYIYIYISDGRNKKSHIMFYRLFRGVAKYIVSGNTFS